MTIYRYDLQTQAVYSELVERLQLAEIQELAEQEGSFVRRLVKGNPYWYLRRRIGTRINERYVGAETPQLLDQIETLKAQSTEAKGAAKGRRDLIRKLRSDGYLMTDRRTGRVIEELARAGVFRLNGVLVGTHAFRCYSALLGMRLQHEFADTGDVDIAKDSSISLGIHESTDPTIGDALAKAERFVEIPDLNPKNPSTGWQTTDQALRVDVLTPLTGKPREGFVELPAFGAHATALRFLDFLLVETVRAAVLTGSGVLVRIPTPERYALHKLIVAQRRAATSRDKSKKDIAQAETLIEALLEDRPDDLLDAWSDLLGRGKKWKTEAMKSVRVLPERFRDVLTGKVELNP